MHTCRRPTENSEQLASRRGSPRTPREAPPAHPPARFVGRFGICAKNGADRTPPELQGPILRPCLGPRSS
eukprot:13525634-Alexandrium_andersonii.AAC.1